MSLEQKLSEFFPHTPLEVIDRVLSEARKSAMADFDVYAIAKPVLQHVEAAYKMLDRLTKRFEALQSSDCGDENCLVIVLMRRIVEEEVASLIEQITQVS